MKFFKYVLCFFLCTTVFSVYAQSGSFYSYYGLGLSSPRQTISQRGMGSVSVLSDSIHLNLVNPASYGHLHLTTFSVGATYEHLTKKDPSTSAKLTSDDADLSYFAVGIPMKHDRVGLGFGVTPITKVKFQTQEVKDNISVSRLATGGLNQVFLSSGFSLSKDLNVGLTLNYNFGQTQYRLLAQQSGDALASRTYTTSDYKGFGYTFGLHYKNLITSNLQVQSSITSSPSYKLSATHTHQIASVAISNNIETIQSSRQEVYNRTYIMPANINLGLGLGRPNYWQVAVNFEYQDAQEFSTSTFNQLYFYNNPSTVPSFDSTRSYMFGAWWTPKYNSLTNYWQKVTYRVGFDYKDLGLLIDDIRVDEFGISFGLGFPVQNRFSNVNVAFEYRKRSRDQDLLVQEDLFQISLGLSLNDKWFKRLKYK